MFAKMVQIHATEYHLPWGHGTVFCSMDTRGGAKIGKICLVKLELWGAVPCIMCGGQEEVSNTGTVTNSIGLNLVAKPSAHLAITFD